MTSKEQNEGKEYATIYQLCLHETTLVRSTKSPGKNDYMVYSKDYQVTRVSGGWIYDRMFGNHISTNFVADTRNPAAQELANKPRIETK